MPDDPSQHGTLFPVGTGGRGDASSDPADDERGVKKIISEGSVID
jgi:hypothetical protein